MSTGTKPPLSAFILQAINRPLATEKSLFGGTTVRFGVVLQTGAWLYEAGAIIGRALPGKLSILAATVANPGDEELSTLICHFPSIRLSQPLSLPIAGCRCVMPQRWNGSIDGI